MRYSYYLDWVVIWLIHIGHGPLLLTIHCVVVFTVLVLNRIHNTLSAFKSKLESELRPSIAPLHHCFDLFTKSKCVTKQHDKKIDRMMTLPLTNEPHSHCFAWLFQMSEGCILLWFLGCNHQSESSWIPARGSGRLSRLKSTTDEPHIRV